jgi:sugar lactone lactonase YvrE
MSCIIRAVVTELVAELVVDAHATLGEGPVWDADAGMLWWVDIEGKEIHRFDPATRADTTIPTPSHVGAVALRARGGLLAALADGIWTLDPGTGALERWLELGEPPHVRSNESKCDPAGRFLVGTMAYDYAPLGSLYSIEADGSIRLLLSELEIANGMAWSADGGTFYYIDSPTRRVDAFDYDLKTGTISRPRPHLAFDIPVAKPDGMAIDSEGGLWIAFWDAAEVRRYGPDRSLDVVVRVPAMQVTSAIFGGPDLRDLYITSATTGLSAAALAEQPLAGGLFHVRIPVAGLLPDRFAG